MESLGFDEAFDANIFMLLSFTVQRLSKQQVRGIDK